MTEKNIFVYKLFLFGRRFNNSANYSAKHECQPWLAKTCGPRAFIRLVVLEHLVDSKFATKK